MPRTRIKVCGITRTEDALVAVEGGADALGFVFYESSPRAVSIGQAKLIASALPPFVSVVALFVNAHSDTIEQVLAEVPVALLQFHGDETCAECERFDRPYIKALRMREEMDVMAEMQRFPSASGFLLDSYKKGVPGGTGKSFDWQQAPTQSGRPIILAGGLHAGNIREAIDAVHPYAVDVSSGVEVEPGIKNPQLICEFIANCRF